jgi:tRNA-(ms[2]io[6]A)-hydroxylase
MQSPEHQEVLERSDLPLLITTPDEWADEALADPLALLNDHAHLEKKAAANALELLLRWPERNPPENWVKAMTSIAKDEVEHLALVTRLLARRGGHLSRSHSNGYAAALRKLVRRGLGEMDTIDRLMISALIEARSCERFEILARRSEDEELARIYRGLWSSERGHYLVFIDLARQVAERIGFTEVDARWREMLELEASILQAQSPGPRIHAWLSGS